MLRLDVEDYCHECETFEPYVSRRIVTVDGNPLWSGSDTIIYCENRTKCEKLIKYLKEQVKQE